MKTTYVALALALTALFVIGCGPKDDAAAPSGAQTPDPSASTSPGSSASGELGPIATAAAYEAGSKKVGDKGICIVCSVNGGKAGEEEDVKETLDYKDKTYVFCNESEKADFISDPEKYVSK